MVLDIIKYIQYFLHGASQVVLQKSVLAGGLCLTGIALGGNSLFAGACTSLAIATAIGRNCQGLSGFNAMLAGCAGFALLEPTFPTWILIIIGAILTVPIRYILNRLLKRINVTSLTLPFIFVTWLMLATAPALGISYKISESGIMASDISAVSIFEGLLKGLSQIFLVNSWIGGLLIWLGLYISDRKSALWAIIGSATGMTMAAASGCEWDQIVNGIWGFSAALTAIALCKNMSTLLTMAAIAATFISQFALSPILAAFGMPVLTLPFCIITLIFQLLHNLRCNRSLRLARTASDNTPDRN